MKQLTSYNRVAGYLNKLFDLLNQRFFESALSRPTITIQSTPRAYVHVLLGKHADTGNVVRNQTAHAGDSAVLTSMYSAMRRS